MKNTTRLIIAGVAAVALATGTFALARGGHGGGERMVERLSDRLELTDQQQASLQALSQEMLETRELMRGDSESTANRLQGLLAADTFDQGLALEMITERTTALQTQAPELVAAAATFVDGLQPEQKDELVGLMERFSERDGRGQHHGRADAMEAQ